MKKMGKKYPSSSNIYSSLPRNKYTDHAWDCSLVQHGKAQIDKYTNAQCDCDGSCVREENSETCVTNDVRAKKIIAHENYLQGTAWTEFR